MNSDVRWEKGNHTLEQRNLDCRRIMQDHAGADVSDMDPCEVLARANEDYAQGSTSAAQPSAANALQGTLHRAERTVWGRLDGCHIGCGNSLAPSLMIARCLILYRWQTDRADQTHRDARTARITHTSQAKPPATICIMARARRRAFDVIFRLLR
jgi:hypothetical protein